MNSCRRKHTQVEIFAARKLTKAPPPYKDGWLTVYQQRVLESMSRQAGLLLWRQLWLPACQQQQAAPLQEAMPGGQELQSRRMMGIATVTRL